ncbi:hypothetical protein EVAR_20995_1 [Eumeta japonica]|uniref:Uncharacterized protein n=1 Tax=Eumeta variegata TaxID=151549 RepID=A0A4C1V754_EUMVA|nr:hypothetical protein EVAR_20995_1 [Eumeta japonica]
MPRPRRAQFAVTHTVCGMAKDALSRVISVTAGSCRSRDRKLTTASSSSNLCPPSTLEIELGDRIGYRNRDKNYKGQDWGICRMFNCSGIEASISNCSHSNGEPVSRSISMMEQNNFCQLRGSNLEPSTSDQCGSSAADRGRVRHRRRGNVRGRQLNVFSGHRATDLIGLIKNLLLHSPAVGLNSDLVQYGENAVETL